MKLIIKLCIFTFLLISLGSCNLFFSSPHGRGNLDDDAAQITAFTAVPSSDNSVVTMWNWKDPRPGINDDIITEIQIQHSIFGYPENFVFFAGERFTDNSIWQHEWKDLIPGITHYFSIFALATNGDGDDIRYAPIKAKVKLPGTAKSSVFGFTDSFQVDDGGPVFVESKSIAVSVDNSAGPWSVLVVELDVPDNIYVISATIETGAAGGIEPGTPLRVFPVTRYWDEDPNSSNGYLQLTDNFKNDYAVDDSVSALIGDVDPTINDVTEVVRKALIFKPKQIVFKFEGSGGTSVDVNNPSFASIEYISN